jgi:hypothetical protein
MQITDIRPPEESLVPDELKNRPALQFLAVAASSQRRQIIDVDITCTR